MEAKVEAKLEAPKIEVKIEATKVEPQKQEPLISIKVDD